jgi:hypothetical protein
MTKFSLFLGKILPTFFISHNWKKKKKKKKEPCWLGGGPTLPPPKKENILFQILKNTIKIMGKKNWEEIAPFN